MNPKAVMVQCRRIETLGQLSLTQLAYYISPFGNISTSGKQKVFCSV